LGTEDIGIESVTASTLSNFFHGTIHAMPKKPFFYKSLCEHFECDPVNLPVLTQNYPSYERENLYYAMQEIAKTCDEPPDLRGVILPDQYQPVSLAKLSRPASAKHF